ncbi:hypothetical protein ACWEX2_11975 [Staphylococcus xylosus]|nr:hypothetical protein [Staphylococcus xylosus]
MNNNSYYNTKPIIDAEMIEAKVEPINKRIANETELTLSISNIKY